MTTTAAHLIDIGIFVVFLIANLVVGLSYGRGLKSMRDYSIGNKDFSTATLTATIVVSWIGGGDIFYMLKHTYTDGLYFVIVIIGAAICLLLIGQLATRMGEFLNDLSVAEAMGNLYGKTVRIITATSGILSVISVVAIEFQVISKMITLIFGFESHWIIVLSATIVILYSISGGIQAVTFTDVFQFLVFGTFMPLLALVIWNNLKDPAQVVQTLNTNPNFSFREVVGWHPKFMGSLAMFIWFVIPGMDPAVFQRISMSRNVLQAQRSFTYAGMISLLTNIFVIWLGILLLSSAPNLDPDNLFTHIINNYASTGLRGLIGVGIIALAMSTADSYLNSSAVLLANDIVKPLNIPVRRETLLARVFCFFSGFLALLLALYSDELLKLLLLSNSFYMPIVSVPLLLAILGFRSSKRATLIGMGLGFVTVTFWHLFLIGTSSIAPGMLANLIGLVGSHYLLKEKGGWQKVAADSPLGLKRAARRQAWLRRFQDVKNFRPYSYLQQNLPIQESFYFFFGLYAIAATYTAFYTISSTDIKAYQNIYEGIYRSVLFVTTAFLTFPIWPSSIKSRRFITFFWPLGIGAVLFFAGTLLAIMSHFQYMQVMIMMINLLMAVLLLYWPLVLLLAVTGVALAVVFFERYTGSTLSLSMLGSLHMIYLLLLFTCLLIALKGRQAYLGLITSYAKLSEDNSFANQALLATFQCRARLQQATSMDFLETLTHTEHRFDNPQRYRRGRTFTKDQLLADNAALQQHTYKLDILNKHLRQVLHLAQEPMHLVVEHVSLRALWQEALKTLRQNNKKVKVITQYDTACETLQTDVGKLKKLLLAALSHALVPLPQRESHPILLGIEDTILAYPIMSIPGYVKKVKSIRISITSGQVLPGLGKFYIGSVDQVAYQGSKDAEEFPIAYNQQIVDAHYGFSEITTNATGTTQVYVIPWDVREVRPYTMDLWNVAPSDSAVETRVHPLEASFVKRVSTQTSLDDQLLQDALQLIKQCHGVEPSHTGEPFYMHAIAVAQIVLDYTRDPDTILAALLHSTIDTSHLSLHQIALHFNPAVQRIVDGVAHVDSRIKSFKKVQLSAYEKILKLSETRDKRVLYVKLADRLHSMRTIEAHTSLAKQQSIAEEILRFFVPIVERLGLKSTVDELKERCFAVLNSNAEESERA